MKPQLEGLTLAEVASKLDVKYSYRIVERDGVGLIVTADVRRDRVSLRMRDGKVVSWYFG